MGGGTMLTPLSGAAGAAINGGITTNLNHSHRPSSSSSLPFKHIQSMDRKEDKLAIGSLHDSVFGPVPSRIEVEKAISDLQRFIQGIHTSEFDWLQQMSHLYDPRTFQSPGNVRVDEAFRLLQTKPWIQRMVVSMSSDKAVWDAIMNNNAVQNLRQSFITAKEERPQSSSSEELDLVALILDWIFDITKEKVLELIEKFTSLVNKIFQSPVKEKLAAEINNQLGTELQSSFLLSIVILLIVVVTRAYGV